MKTNTLDVPIEALRINEKNPVKVQFDDQPEAKARWRMVANSGQAISHWWWGKLAIDLKGLQVNKESIPALRDHDTLQIVGSTDKIEVDKNEGLVAEGVFTEATEAGREALALAADDFPWQASIYFPPLLIEEVLTGEEAQVNGYTFTGPGYIIRKATLREVSFCALGADEQTSVNKLSGATEKIQVNLSTKKEELNMKDLTIDKLKADRPDLVTALKDSFTAEFQEKLVKAESESFDKGVDFEKTRLAAILDEAKTLEGKRGVKLSAKVGDLISEGTEIKDAVLELRTETMDQMAAGIKPATGSNADSAVDHTGDKTKASDVQPPSEDNGKSHLAAAEEYKLKYKCSLSDALKATAPAKKE